MATITREDQIINKFNNDTKAIEFVGGTTYCVELRKAGRYYRLKSSNLDELLDMYVAAWGNKTVPARTCFFHKPETMKYKRQSLN